MQTNRAFSYILRPLQDESAVVHISLVSLSRMVSRYPILIFILIDIALKVLKTEASSTPFIYEFEYNQAFLHAEYRKTPTISCFQKIRVLSLALHRRGLPISLETQCKVTNIQCYTIPLDMPVRWSSTKVTLEKFYSMKAAITTVMVTQ